MESVQKSERELELERCIDSLVDEMNVRYGADLTDEARVDAMMSDIKLRDDLIRLLAEAIRGKKICERIKAEQKEEVAYYVYLTATSGCMHFDVARNCIRRFAPSE